MISSEPRPARRADNPIQVLPTDRSWTSIAVVVHDRVDPASRDLAVQLAQRHAARIILYDKQASSGWTSPFPPGEDVLPVLLDEPGIRRSGRDAVADAVRDLQQDGIAVSAHLSNTRHAADLRSLVVAEAVDLVICPIPLSGNTVRNVHLVRRAGAHLLCCPPGEGAVLHAPLQPGETVPVEQRVQVRFLVGLLLTFLAAGLRNRSSS